jgi:DNA-binding NarL/FixJ family response regulator
VSDDSRELVIELFRAGKTYAAIGHDLDLSEGCVSRHISAARADGVDLPARVRGPGPGKLKCTVEAVAALIRQGLTSAVIAERVGLSPGTVWSYANRARKAGLL